MADQQIETLTPERAWNSFQGKYAAKDPWVRALAQQVHQTKGDSATETDILHALSENKAFSSKYRIEGYSPSLPPPKSSLGQNILEGAKGFGSQVMEDATTVAAYSSPLTAITHAARMAVDAQAPPPPAESTARGVGRNVAQVAEFAAIPEEAIEGKAAKFAANVGLGMVQAKDDPAAIPGVVGSAVAGHYLGKILGKFIPWMKGAVTKEAAVESDYNIFRSKHFTKDARGMYQDKYGHLYTDERVQQMHKGGETPESVWAKPVRPNEQSALPAGSPPIPESRRLPAGPAPGMTEDRLLSIQAETRLPRERIGVIAKLTSPDLVSRERFLANQVDRFNQEQRFAGKSLTKAQQDALNNLTRERQAVRSMMRDRGIKLSAEKVSPLVTPAPDERGLSTEVRSGRRASATERQAAAGIDVSGTPRVNIQPPARITEGEGIPYGPATDTRSHLMSAVDANKVAVKHGVDPDFIVDVSRLSNEDAVKLAQVIAQEKGRISGPAGRVYPDQQARVNLLQKMGNALEDIMLYGRRSEAPPAAVGFAQKKTKLTPTVKEGESRTVGGSKQVLRRIPIEDIEGDPGNTIHEPTVKGYQERGYAEPAELRPKPGAPGKFIIQEGHHRLLSDVRGGADSVLVWVPESKK